MHFLWNGCGHFEEFIAPATDGKWWVRIVVGVGSDGDVGGLL